MDGALKSSACGKWEGRRGRLIKTRYKLPQEQGFSKNLMTSCGGEHKRELPDPNATISSK